MNTHRPPPPAPTTPAPPAPFLTDPPAHVLGCDCPTCGEMRAASNNDSVGRLLDTIERVFLRPGRAR